MRYFYLYLLSSAFFLLSLNAASQYVVKGRVVDAQDHPLANASVYINGSTAGTVTDTKGAFRLGVTKGGFAEIVVTYVGYETLVYQTEIKAINADLLFKLEPKAQEMRNVLVLTSTTRKKWLKIFKDNFLGITTAAERCTIENEEDIQFEAGSTSSHLKAFSDVPLVVVNKELGYKVHFHLIAFAAEEQRTFFVGYSRFEELKPSAKKRWVSMRERYYQGSSAHFFRSLIQNQLEQDGFRLRLLKETNLSLGVIDSSKSGSVAPQKAWVSLPVVVDSILQVRAEAQELNYLLQYTGKLEVSYLKDPYSRAALSRKVLMTGIRPKGVVSYIELLEKAAILDKTGGVKNPLSMQYSGFWIYEKLGTMLPLDYTP